MYLNDLIQPYLSYLKMYNSMGTYNFTKQICKSLLTYFHNMPIESISKQTIYDYIIYCNSEGLSNNSINKRVAMLKRLFKFHDIECSFQSVRNLKVRFITYGALDDKTLTKFYDVVPKLSLANQCMMYLFIECGVRVNELIHIKKANVNLDNRYIFLEQTKTNTPRYVYFSNHTKDLLMLYLTQIKDNKSIYLFGSKKNNCKLSRYTINGTFSRIRKKYKFDKLSPHMLRHTLSTKLYNNGANILFICSIMGHSNPNTTKRYVHNDLENDLKMFDLYYSGINKQN